MRDYPALMRQVAPLLGYDPRTADRKGVARYRSHGSLKIDFDHGTSENNRRAKFYRLTAKGRKQLTIETSKWDALAAAVGRILRPAAEEQ